MDNFLVGIIIYVAVISTPFLVYMIVLHNRIQKRLLKHQKEWGEIKKSLPNDDWDKGEPYEEPTQSDEALLADLIHSSNAVDFDTAIKLSPWLIANGVTFREG